MIDVHPVQHPVLLVGAGPGDPDLITLAGAEALRQADVVLHDRLVSRELLRIARAAELVDVGKRPGGPSQSQAEINDLLVDRARRGQRVVRLKGGDPFVFGRGGEEAEALSDADVPWRIIPGVTSATAAAAAAGIAVTDRRAASALTIVTGSEGDGGAPPIDWTAVAQVGGTIVLMMSWRQLDDVVERLLDCGLAPDTPAAAIERATTPNQRAIRAPIAALGERATDLQPPVTVVIGPTVDLAREPTQGPLHGRRIVVTRARAQADSLIRRLAELGAEVIALPTIEIVPLEDDDSRSMIDAALDRLAAGEYRVLALTSVNGVDLFWRALRQRNLDARVCAEASIAAIGAETARALQQRGLVADVVPEVYTSEALANALLRSDVRGQRILLARAARGSREIRQRLRDAGATVDDLALYDTITPNPDPMGWEHLRHGVDVVTLTSPSTAQGLAAMINASSDVCDLDSLQTVCIGPVTAEAARALGFRVAAIAEVHNMAGLINAVQEFVRSDHLATAG